MEMQTFDAFANVYNFIVRSALDKGYVRSIDQSLEDGSAPRATRTLIQHVRAFHRMRASLCSDIAAHLGSTPILRQLAAARGLEQFDTVPNQCTCAISGEKLRTAQGVLLMLDGKTPVTIHKRYKTSLYYFWYLAHLAEDIQLEARTWMQQQKWWKRGRAQDVDDCIERVANFQDQTFPKKIYVKLKGMSQYIQKQVPALPINPSR
jgi:hypothetical protein